MSESTAVELPGFLSPDGSIAVDLHCKRCTYNLRGLREEGRCPECGMPVAHSTVGDLLYFRDPVWVAKLSCGLSIIFWTSCAMLLQSLGSYGTSMVYAIWFPALWSSATAAPGPFPLLRVFWNILFWAAFLVSFCGVWLVTTPNPAGVGSEAKMSVRATLRVVVACYLVVRWLVELPPGPTMAKGVIHALYLGAIGFFAVEIGKYILYEKLAGHTPIVGLIRRARLVKWVGSIGLPAAFVAHEVLGRAQTLFAFPSSYFFVRNCCGLTIDVVTMLIIPIMTILLVWRLRTAVLAQARLARQLAAQNPPH